MVRYGLFLQTAVIRTTHSMIFIRVLRCLVKPTLWLVYVFTINELITRFLLFIAGENIEVYRNFSFTRFPKIYMHDPYTQFRMKPGSKGAVLTSDFKITYEINSQGLREKEISREKTRPRILFLGDSFTFAEGVPVGERFTDIVGKAFPDIETINAGVPGYGIQNMYRWYEHYGDEIKGDLVLCCISECDIDRAIYAFLGEQGKHIIPREESVEGRDRTHLVAYLVSGSAYTDVRNYLDRRLKSSYFYSYLSVKYKVAVMSWRLEKRDQEMWNTAKTRAKQRDIGDKEFKERYREKVAGQIFRSLRDLTAQRGARFMIVNIDVMPMGWLDHLLRKLDVPYIDLSPILANAKGFRYKIDPHYNSYGNKLIGEALTEVLSKTVPALMEESHV
ncbi:MAG: hypothetical protein COT35_06105 [Nitrospirae bacterium CG08_land_8_20_14_0_20_52_24]|nr:MAG: hypothetical protein COT35_06105 [Nitrospirae bacterium CG08_land_8_20_14_0_20_52_24]